MSAVNGYLRQFGLNLAVLLLLIGLLSPAALAKTSEPTPENRAGTADLQAATDLMVEGRYDDAAQAFNRVLTTEPQNIHALGGLGMALSRQNKLSEADEQFDKVLAVDAKNPVAHCGKALVLLFRVERNQLEQMTRLDALKKAGRECNKALDADPRVVEAHFLLGKVYKEEGRMDLATQAFSGAIRLDPHYAAAYNMLAAVQVLKGNLAEAVENYKQSISLAPKNSAAHIGLAEVYTKQGRLADAATELNSAIAINPNSLTAHLMLAKSFELKGNTTGAVQEYLAATKARPEELEPYKEIARIYEERGDFELAAAALRNALDVLPRNTELRCRLGDDLLRAGKADEAVREFKEVLAAVPSNADAAIGLSRVCYMKLLSATPGTVTGSDDFLSCARLIAQCAKAAPTDPVLKLADASMRALAGQTVELSTMSAPQSLAQRKIYAQLLMAMKKFPEAGAMLSAAANSSTDANDVLNVGDTALQLHELDSAEKAFRRAATFAGAEQRARRGLALVSEARQLSSDNLNHANQLASTKQFALAAQKYRLALAADPRLADARIGLAESLDKNAQSSANPGVDLKDALGQYNAYLAVSPGLPARERERIQRRISRLEAMLAHADQTPNLGWRGLFQRFSMR